MDASEAVVEKLLKHLGFQSIIYEPDGNTPPDFLVDGRIAVEVRRLNQNYDSGDGRRGLEEASIPLWHKLERLAHSLGSGANESWYLYYRFGRPVKPWKELKPKLRSALVEFMAQSERRAGRVYTDGNFELEVIPASQPLEHNFRMGGVSDHQSGGSIVAEMLQNIDHCVTEKLQKIAIFREKYPVWWLVFTDHIGFGLDDNDKQQLLEHVKRPAGWDKIIVVSPSDPTNWLDF